jgi:hypothetical protein
MAPRGQTVIWVLYIPVLEVEIVYLLPVQDLDGDNRDRNE